MARKFTGAARPRGFNPVQISSANIRQMQAENERILEGMRQRQLSARRNEEEILRSMKEDSEYARRSRDRNYNINKGNIETQIQQSQYDQAADAFQAQEKLKATLGIVESIANFSDTASKFALEVEKEQEKRETEELTVQAENYFAEGYRPDSLRSQERIYDIEAETMEETGQQAEMAKLMGAQVKLSNQAHALSVMNSDIGRSISAKNTVDLGWKSFSLKWIQENSPEAYGNSDAVQELLPEIWKTFKEENNLNENYTPEILAEALKEKNKIDKSLISGIDAKENELIESELITEYTNLAMGNLPEYGALAYRNVSRIEGNREAGFKLIEKIATLQDPDGSFLYSEDQVGDLVLDYRNDERDPEGTIIGKKFRDSNAIRFLEIQNKREEKRREWNRNQATTDRQDYYQMSKRWHELLKEEGFTPENLAAVEEAFQYNMRGVPDWVKVYKASGTEAKRNSTLITIAQDLKARGVLPQSMVNEIYKFDPQEAVKLQEDFNKQNPYSANADYVKTLEIVEGLPLQKNEFGGKGTETAGSLESSKALKEMFVMIFEGHVANGMTMSKASIRALRDIEEGIRRDAGNPNGTFFRKSTTQLNVFEFPNLIPKNFQSALDKAVEEETLFRQQLDNGSVDQIFANPNSIFTDEQFVKEIQEMQQPGYKFKGKVALLSKKIKATPLEVMTKIAETKNMTQMMPPPPPSMQVARNYSPAIQAMLNLHSTVANNRAHGRGSFELGHGYAEHLVPQEYRGFIRDSAERHGLSPAEGAVKIEIESAWNPLAESYNGTSFGLAQINRSAHPEFFANGDWRDPAYSIDYGLEYFAGLKRQFGGDVIAAAMAYNGGSGHYNAWLAGVKPEWVTDAATENEWQRVKTEMINHGKKFAKGLYKYTGDSSILNHPLLKRN
jgi:hypothetical protein|tara:strand:- start:4195 stop:6900 length:2706 start_codon:yes stop_codon:yes gene_type:complete